MPNNIADNPRIREVKQRLADLGVDWDYTIKNQTVTWGGVQCLVYWEFFSGGRSIFVDLLCDMGTHSGRVLWVQTTPYGIRHKIFIR